jgi:hypothetical protein
MTPTRPGGTGTRSGTSGRAPTLKQLEARCERLNGICVTKYSALTLAFAGFNKATEEWLANRTPKLGDVRKKKFAALTAAWNAYRKADKERFDAVRDGFNAATNAPAPTGGNGNTGTG